MSAGLRGAARGTVGLLATRLRGNNRDPAPWSSVRISRNLICGDNRGPDFVRLRGNNQALCGDSQGPGFVGLLEHSWGLRAAALAAAVSPLGQSGWFFPLYSGSSEEAESFFPSPCWLLAQRAEGWPAPLVLQLGLGWLWVRFLYLLILEGC